MRAEVIKTQGQAEAAMPEKIKKGPTFVLERRLGVCPGLTKL
jgi:hypothetical protein